jgi:hypothetical protein
LASFLSFDSSDGAGDGVAGFARAGGLLVATLTVPDDVEETVAVLFVLVILLTVDVVLPVVADTLFVPTSRVP